jgi:hypothetical protein
MRNCAARRVWLVASYRSVGGFFLWKRLDIKEARGRIYLGVDLGLGYHFLPSLRSEAHFFYAPASEGFFGKGVVRTSRFGYNVGR